MQNCSDFVRTVLSTQILLWGSHADSTPVGEEFIIMGNSLGVSLQFVIKEALQDIDNIMKSPNRTERKFIRTLSQAMVRFISKKTFLDTLLQVESSRTRVTKAMHGASLPYVHT